MTTGLFVVFEDEAAARAFKLYANNCVGASPSAPQYKIQVNNAGKFLFLIDKDLPEYLSETAVIEHHELASIVGELE